MSKPESERTQLMYLIHRKAGCRLDDAAAAADVSIRFYEEKRIELMRKARKTGLSYEVIGDSFGIHRSVVYRLLQRGEGLATPSEGNIPPAA